MKPVAIDGEAGLGRYLARESVFDKPGAPGSVARIRLGPRQLGGAWPPRRLLRPRVDIPAASSDPPGMSVALAAIDPAALRPHSDRSSRVLHTETWIHHPVAFHGEVPEIRTVFLLRAARDVESNRLLVTSYTHAGLAFEAEDFAGAMRRAVEIVPDFAIAAGLAAEGIAIVLDEYPSIDDLDLG